MIADIRLQNYRSYVDRSFAFSPGVNIIVGPNASGKTNLLEAIIVVCGGNSYRAKDLDLINHSQDWLRIDGLTKHKIRRIVKIIKTNDKANKEFIIDNKVFKRLTNNSSIPIVLFEPNQIVSLTSSPDLRRSYLDNLLDQLKLGYKKNRLDYLKVLRHRNALLKQPNSLRLSYFPWEVRLSRLGGLISRQRQKLIDDLNLQINDIYNQIANTSSNLRIEYLPSFKLDTYESLMINSLEKDYQIDVLRGFTTKGPHREDMTIYINDKPIALNASRGEIRTIILALKQFEASILTKSLNQQPIILLDDVFSELDNGRRKSLMDYFKEYQVLITATDIDHSYKTNIIRL